MNLRNEDEVYVIGRNNKTLDAKRKKAFICLAALVTLLIVMLVMVYAYSQDDGGQKSDTQVLQTVNVLPDNAKAPLFMGRHDMNEFIVWLSNQVKYPKGLELEDARVVVSFVITEQGVLDSIAIVSQPKEKAFGEQVVKILRQCPRWESGKLADGTPTAIRYTLPFNFNKQRTFN